MRPVLADIELLQVQEIRVADVRSLAEHKPPGKDGSLLQDLGRVPTLLSVWGMATGPDAPGFIESLKTVMRPGEPVSFVADITSEIEIEQFIVDDLAVRQLAGRPDRLAYALTLREYMEAVEPETASAVQGAVLSEADDLLGDLLDGLDLAGAFTTGLEQFITPLGDLLERLTKFRQDINGTDT